MPEISIIVPVYKAEQYLPDCIDSILSQTFSDFEVILVDDGSPDNCLAICREYAARDSRVSVIHQENQGQAAARNHGLSQARGQWVCFVDSDDLIHPQMVELLYHAAVDGGTGISMCRMLEAAVPPGDFFQPCQGDYDTVGMDEATLVSLFDRDAYPGWVACAKLIRREIVETHLFCPGRVYEDNEAVCHWLQEAGTVAQMTYPLYFYRSNPESTTQKNFSLKKLDYLWALEQIVRFYTLIGYSQLRDRFCNLYAEAAAGCYYRVKYELNRPDVAREIEKSVWRLVRNRTVPLTKKQFETLLDAMHPKLIRLYWPAEAAVRTLREKGVAGLARKAAEQLRKGDRK